MSKEHVCVKDVWERAPGTFYGGHSRPCKTPAVVERDGKWYCGVHDPAKGEARRAEREAKWKREGALRQARARVAAAERGIVAIARAEWAKGRGMWSPLIEPLRELEAAEAALAALEVAP